MLSRPALSFRHAGPGMRQHRIALLADRLTALLPKNGLSVSGHDAKVRLQYHDSTITEHDFEGAVALAAARCQETVHSGVRE